MLDKVSVIALTRESCLLMNSFWSRACMRLRVKLVKKVITKIAIPDKNDNPRYAKSTTKQITITNGSLRIIGACPVKNCILTASTYTKLTIWPKANRLLVQGDTFKLLLKIMADMALVALLPVMRA